MDRRIYNNFVPSSQTDSASKNRITPHLSGDEAQRIYLEEFLDNDTIYRPKLSSEQRCLQDERTPEEDIKISNKDIFYAAQNNDVSKLVQALKNSPDKVNLRDDFGWTLLMIACQANSMDIVKELLKRGADTTFQDKAGNSARTLVIRNKNIELAQIFLNHSNSEEVPQETNNIKVKRRSSKDKFVCEICKEKFNDRKKHLSSTVHNINLNNDTAGRIWYGIPETNRGYQIMLKGGWERTNGLGRDGSGKKYPIRAVQKLDRKGLGHEKVKVNKSVLESVNRKSESVRSRQMDHYRNKRMEINFRREFY